MAVPNTPEQQAALDAFNKKMAGVFGAGSPAATNAAQGVQNEVNTANAITGQGQDAKFMYGGHAGGAHEAANRYNQLGIAAQGRAGEVIDTTQSNETRGQAMSMAELMARRARGETPSIAQAMADRNMGQVAAEQSSAAASARGPAALALAQQNAAANTSAAQSNISGQAQINAMQERQQAEQAAFGAYGNMRGQDQAGALAQATINAQQRAQNDQMQLGMTGFETGVQTSQLNANMQQAGMAATGAQNYAQMMEQRRQQRNAETGQALQGAATVAGTFAMMSDMRSKDPAPMPGQPPNEVIEASNALDAMKAQEAAGYPERQVMQPLAVAGVDALERRDQEEAGLIKSKQAAGAKLTDKEQRSQPLLAKRLGRQAPEPTKGERLGAGLSKLGSVFAAPSAPAPALAAFHMAPVAAPTMYSDDRTKLRAAFMAGVTREMNRDNPEGQPELPEYMVPGGRKSPEGVRYTVEDFKAQPGNPNQPLGRGSPFVRQFRPSPDEEKAISFSARRPADDPMAQANRSMAAAPYTYKPEFAAKTGQSPGEVNVGPTAQNMAADPVASTAVQQDPQTGMLALDRDKLAKVTAGGVASLQGQVDELRSLMATRLRGKR